MGRLVLRAYGRAVAVDAPADALTILRDLPLPLERAAEAHGRVDAGTGGRVLLAIPEP